MRTLNYTAKIYKALPSNIAHQFAAKHALRLYSHNAIYSFIPKNACSTLRLSLALANKCIESTEDYNWIHNNNQTFRADLPSLVTAKYTFTVLRCPYSRLASVYLDKIVNRDIQAWGLVEMLKRQVKIEDITFARFITALLNPTIRNSDIHWRPQIDFLVYKQYDDYFCLEQFPTAISTLKDKINFTVVDARPLTRHGTDKFELIHGENFSDTKPDKIKALKSAGRCPSPNSLYTEELASIVAEYYKADIDLYRRLFGSTFLMFDGSSEQ